jgi:hypothetical protein
MSDDGIPYEIYDWHADYSDWNVGTTFDATPIKVTEPDHDNAVWYKHPKADCKVSIRLADGDTHGGKIVSWDVDGGTGKLNVCGRSWFVERQAGDKWKVVG